MYDMYENNIDHYARAYNTTRMLNTAYYLNIKIIFCIYVYIRHICTQMIANKVFRPHVVVAMVLVAVSILYTNIAETCLF